MDALRQILPAAPTGRKTVLVRHRRRRLRDVRKATVSYIKLADARFVADRGVRPGRSLVGPTGFHCDSARFTAPIWCACAAAGAGCRTSEAMLFGRDVSGPGEGLSRAAGFRGVQLYRAAASSALSGGGPCTTRDLTNGRASSMAKERSASAGRAVFVGPGASSAVVHLRSWAVGGLSVYRVRSRLNRHERC